MQTKHFIIATAGHVDHGKSSVVKALTGTDPDRLPEEKARGITIDLGFAHLDLTDPSAPDTIYRVGIVDVPGHEDFVKNMVAGVGAINLALLVVAADDGWMPQTEEHLQILEYLGVRQAVVALTKIDLNPEGEAANIQEVREKLANSAFADAPVIPFSAIHPRGLNELKEALAKQLAILQEPVDAGKPRLSVDRVFSLKGIGTVVTGTLTGGKLKKGEPVVIQPRGAITRLRNIQSHNADVETAFPGTRTALNIPDVADVGEARGVQRGDVITIESLGAGTQAIDVLVERSSRLIGDKGPARPLKDGMIVRWHHGSANFPARLLLRKTRELPAGSSALAQLRFEELVFVLAGERFILRDWSEQVTLGGGIVLDVENVKEQFKPIAQTKFLKARSSAIDQVNLGVKASVERDKFVPVGTLLVKTVFSSEEIADAVRELANKNEITILKDFIADASWWKGIIQQAKDVVSAYHTTNPQLQGMPINDLRTKMIEVPPFTGAFDAFLSALGQEGYISSGNAIRSKQHQQALPPNLQAAGNRIRNLLKERPIDPPSKKEVVPDAVAQQALRFLIETREVVEVSPEIVMLRSAYETARDQVVRELKQKGRAAASGLRQLLNSSRRVVIPLLEKFDKEGITRREGDARVPGKNAG